jgi:hypothetical protein
VAAAGAVVDADCRREQHVAFPELLVLLPCLRPSRRRPRPPVEDDERAAFLPPAAVLLLWRWDGCHIAHVSLQRGSRYHPWRAWIWLFAFSVALMSGAADADALQLPLKRCATTKPIALSTLSRLCFVRIHSSLSNSIESNISEKTDSSRRRLLLSTNPSELAAEAAVASGNAKSDRLSLFQQQLSHLTKRYNITHVHFTLAKPLSPPRTITCLSWKLAQTTLRTLLLATDSTDRNWVAPKLEIR